MQLPSFYRNDADELLAGEEWLKNYQSEEEEDKN